MHGDLHTGNIFIDLYAFRSGKKENYIKNGDTEGIAKYVLEGATLPSGMSKEKAYEVVNGKLKEIFFGKEMFIKGGMNIEELMKLTDGILHERDYVE